MTRIGSLPCCIVSFQAFEGLNDPYGITSGILLSENSSRTYCSIMASIFVCVSVCVGVNVYSTMYTSIYHIIITYSVVDSSYAGGWWLKDQSIKVVLITTSNKTEVGEKGGRPSFYPLATCNPDIIIILLLL